MFSFDKKNGSIRAYGVVGLSEDDEGFGPEDFIKAFDAMGGQDVRIELQSPGGDVISGRSIFNQINDYSGEVTIVIDAMAASIASVLMLAADDILAFPNSRIMVHNPWTMVIGDVHACRSAVAMLEMTANDIAEDYANATGRDTEFWLDKMDAETFFSAAEALEVGLITGIYKGSESINAKVPEMAKPRMAHMKAVQSRLGLARKRLGF